MEYLIAFIAAAVLLVLVAWLVGRAIGRPRKEQPAENVRGKRLSVIESIAVDEYRRLMIVRRDQAEHLIMVGGPSDIVVESNIGRGQPARRPQQPPATQMPAGQQAAMPPRPAQPQPSPEAGQTAMPEPPSMPRQTPAPPSPVQQTAAVEAENEREQPPEAGTAPAGASAAAAGLAAGAAALAAAQAQKAATRNGPVPEGSPGFPAPINVKEILGIEEPGDSEPATGAKAVSPAPPADPPGAPQSEMGSPAKVPSPPSEAPASEDEAGRGVFGKRGGPSPDRLKSVMAPTTRQDDASSPANGTKPAAAAPAPTAPAEKPAEPQPASPAGAVNPFPNLAGFDIEELQRSLDGVEPPATSSPEAVVEDKAAKGEADAPLRPAPPSPAEAPAAEAEAKSQSAAESSAALSDLASRLEAALARQGGKDDGSSGTIGKAGIVTPIGGAGRRPPEAGESSQGDSDAGASGGQDSLEQEMARLLGELTSRKG